MKRFFICTCALCLFCSEESFGKLRSNAKSRRDPWANSHAKTNAKEEYKHTRYRTMRYGPDILFKRIRNRDVEEQDDAKNDSKYKKELDEYPDNREDI